MYKLTLMGLHAGKELGDRATLAEIQQAKDDDLLYQNLEKEESTAAINALVAHQAAKNTNACVTNKGAAHTTASQIVILFAVDVTKVKCI